jgi:hypothetical protein
MLFGAPSSQGSASILISEDPFSHSFLLPLIVINRILPTQKRSIHSSQGKRLVLLSCYILHLTQGYARTALFDLFLNYSKRVKCLGHIVDILTTKISNPGVVSR